MLTDFESLKNRKLDALDGELGKVKDIYFEDDAWAIRYLVVRAGNWLTGQQVLISPVAVDEKQKDKNVLKVLLNQEQIKNSPPYDADKPLSRQFEIEHFKYYGWPGYWGFGAGIWGAGMQPEDLRKAQSLNAEDSIAERTNHLRSSAEVEDYTVQGSDGELGRVTNFIFDTKTWIIRYLVVETSSGISGDHVLLAPGWADKVEWSNQRVVTNLNMSTVDGAPNYSRIDHLNRNYEEELHTYFDETGYWKDSPAHSI